ncbi:MAG: helix-turn-helix domain-containing protein [Lachnospiraceae bacterium]|nr:helix-turn-helix domain-containing protein [Lachnospiraceae bacterium]
MSIYRMCGNIEEQIPGSYACYYNHKIYLLVNMDVNHFSLQDFRKRMVYIIREGLFHIGVSMVFYDILEMQYYFRQAEIALYYGTQQNQMFWYHTFDAYVLDYWMKEGIGTLTKDTIVNPAVYILEQYDREHGTDLYETLKTYLTYERNGTLTARIMKIHRSTLPHRLDRIQRLTGLNLESPEVRLYLLMSFYFHSSV